MFDMGLVFADRELTGSSVPQKLHLLNIQFPAMMVTTYVFKDTENYAWYPFAHSRICLVRCFYAARQHVEGGFS